MLRGVRVGQWLNLITSHMRILLIITIAGALAWGIYRYTTPSLTTPSISSVSSDLVRDVLPTQIDPLSIKALRTRSYTAEAPVIERTLYDAGTHVKHLVSYQSDGLKIYAILAVPQGQPPDGGWPIIMLQHGFIPPAEYDNTAKYVAYVDTLARGGYIIMMSDYRGHGESEGVAAGGYFDPGYTVDVMHALRAVQRLPYANPQEIYLWGHSMGGNVSMRVRAIVPEVKATVIWAGVVGSYPMIFEEFFMRPRAGVPRPTGVTNTRQRLFERYGSPSARGSYWTSTDPMEVVSETLSPIQIHHGVADETVPVRVGERFDEELTAAGVPHELYLYEGENHNINATGAFSIAMERVMAFYKQKLRN